MPCTVADSLTAHVLAHCRLQCWLWHQMRSEFGPPPAAAVQAGAGPAVGGESSFFHEHTVRPLYNILKVAGAPEMPRDESGCDSAIFCCRKLGRTRALQTSARPNYDDFNEVRPPPCPAHRVFLHAR